MLIEFLYHFFTLDLGWMVDFVLGQLFWVMVFAAATVIIFEPKKQFWGFIFFVFLNWAFVDIGAYMGWHLSSAFGPLMFALFLLPAYVFLEKDGKLSKWNLPYAIFGLLAVWFFITFLG